MKQFVKPILVGALSLALVGTAGCESMWGPAFEAKKTVTPAMAWDDAQIVQVSTRNGSIDVRVDPSNTELTVKAEVKARGTTQEEADSRLALMDVELSRLADGTVMIQPVISEGEWISGDGCSLWIVVPAAVSVQAKTSNGPITLNGTGGSADVKTSNGSITISNHAGEVLADTSNGPVRVENAAGNIEVDTSNASITIVGFRGVVDASTSNGPITCESTAENSGPVTLKSSNGGITLRIPSTFGGTISAKTSNGSSKVSGSGFTATGDRTSQTITLSDSGQASTLVTSNGPIKVEVGPQ